MRALHPEYNFVFGLVDKAVDYWRYTRAEACELQSKMLAMACQDSKRADAERGVRILIEDEISTPMARIS